MKHYYIYYRVTERDWLEAASQVRSLQARLSCRTGVRGRLLQKDGEPGLWMEVYEGVADAAGFERLLAQALDEFDLAPYIDGPRRLECFNDATIG